VLIPTTVLTGTSGSASWTKVIDLPLTTLTGWTTVAGTFTTDGTSFAGTAGTPGLLRLDTAYAAAAAVMECEIQLVSGGDNYAGIMPTWGPGTDTIPFRIRMDNTGGTRALVAGTEGNSPLVSVSNSFSLDAYHTLRIVRFGPHCDVYLDDILQFSVQSDKVSSGVTCVGLYHYHVSGNPLYRNLKVWVPSLPT